MKRIIAIVVALVMSAQLFAATDNKAVQELVLKFYGYQRAGLTSGSCNNLNSGFTNASHNGDKLGSNPLDGGWYDAGDYIKFGMNMSYAVYCLLKGYDIFPSGYSNNADWTYKSTDAIPDVLNEAKVGTDWIMKAVISESQVVLDVGLASEEHNTWGVTNASGRTDSKIVMCDGGDIPATYAACLACMSVLYKKYDAEYSAKCLEKAKVAFKFAKTKFDGGKNYCTPQKKSGAALYDYPTVDDKKNQQINDRMVAAGIELYRATNNADPIYRTWAMKGITDFYNCMGYAFIGPLASFEVWRQGLGGSGSLNANIGFIDGKIVSASGQFNKVYQNSGWGTARDIGTVAMEYAMAYVTTANTTARSNYLTKVKNHVDWLTGNLGLRSYICGYNSGPTKIHYRTTNYGAVPGGIVSGPKGLDDNWSNDGTPEHCEVAVDYNAGVVGALAFLRALDNPGDDVKMSTKFSATPTTVDFSTGSVTFSAGFSKSKAWTITINGSFGSKVITGTGTTLSAKWDGTADKGTFLGGESVTAALSVDGNIVAYDLVSALPVGINISKNKKVEFGASDVLIDDFEDSDTINKVSGKWRPNGSKVGFGGTSIKIATNDGSVGVVSSGTVSMSDYTSYSGVKTTFNAEGTAKDLTTAKSVIFDIKGSKAATVYVELEQASITDNTYFSAQIPVFSTQNRYRVNIADFKQPDWKTKEAAFSINAITALRFSVYDSVGSISLYVDNVGIEGFSGTQAILSGLNHKQLGITFKPVISNGIIAYSIPAQIKGVVNMSIFNMAGKTVMKKAVYANTSGVITASIENLPTGIYTVSNTANGEVIDKSMKFVFTK